MSHLQKYIDYIRNTGQVPLKINQFDDDWEPIGPLVRRDLIAAGLIEQADDGIKVKSRAEGWIERTP